MDLPDERVVVAGDWHGDRRWAERAFPAVRAAAPDVRTMLHVGDFWHPSLTADLNASWLDLIDVLAAAAGIQRVLVTLGNHEPWGALTPLLANGQPARVSKVVWALPRPYRFTIAGREVLSLGGAASVNAHQLTEGITWFPDEAITDQHVADAIAGGPADLLLTHEPPADTPVRAVAAALRSSSHWPKAALAASAASRARVSAVWDAANPVLLVHGHMHIPAGGVTPDGRRVSSLGQNEQWGNMLLLDMATLTGDLVPTTR
jgi:hypothetical protein